MYKRFAALAAVAALLVVGISGTASARPIVTADLAPLGLGYNSDGTFEGLADVIDQVCAQAGRHDIPAAEDLRASVCVPRPVDEEQGQVPGDNGYELAQLTTPAIGWSSDGFFDGFKNACELGGLVGVPIEGRTVEVVPGVVVTLCV
jgi:hypothetical protein